MACDAACRWMRGTLRAQVRPRSSRTVRLGFLTTARAPENTPRVPLGVLHRAILTEKCRLNPTQLPPTTRYAPGACSQATGALGDPKTPQNELFGPIFTPCLGPLVNDSWPPTGVKRIHAHKAPSNYPLLRSWGALWFCRFLHQADSPASRYIHLNSHHVGH